MNGFFKVGDHYFNIDHVVEIKLNVILSFGSWKHVIRFSNGREEYFDMDSKEGQDLIRFIEYKGEKNGH